MYHVCNDDVSSGQSYDGVFNLTETLNGNYTLVSQHVDSTAIPWIWQGVHQLHIYSNDEKIDGDILCDFDYSALATETNTATIAASFQTDLNDALGAFIPAQSCTVTYSSTLAGNFYIVTPSSAVVFDFEDEDSTVRHIFGKLTNVNADNSTPMSISATYITTSPKFLEMYIEESSTQYSTTRNTYPTLLLATVDNELTGQQFQFLNNANTLTVSIYRPNIPISPCPIKNRWDIIFN